MEPTRIDAADVTWTAVTGASITHVVDQDRIYEVGPDGELSPVDAPVELAPGVTVELISSEDLPG